MNLYTINKHWRVVETVEVFAESEAEALELAKDAHSNNQDWIEIMDACVTDTKATERPLADIIEEAEEYLADYGNDIHFEPISADWTNYYDPEERLNRCELTGAFSDEYGEIQCEYYNERGQIDTQPLCNFTDADQYRICEAILNRNT